MTSPRRWAFILQEGEPVVQAGVRCLGRRKDVSLQNVTRVCQPAAAALAGSRAVGILSAVPL